MAVVELNKCTWLLYQNSEIETKIWNYKVFWNAMQKRFVFSLQLLWSVCNFSCIYALVYRFYIPLIWLPRTLLYFHSTFSSQVFQWTYHGAPLGRIMLFNFLVVYLLGFSNVWIMFVYIKLIQSWRVCKRNVLYIQWRNLPTFSVCIVLYFV